MTQLPEPAHTSSKYRSLIAAVPEPRCRCLSTPQPKCGRGHRLGCAHRHDGRTGHEHTDGEIDSLLRSLAAETESDLQRGMHFPDRWDPFFADYMTLEDLYRYPAQYFDFHRRQLTLD